MFHTYTARFNLTRYLEKFLDLDVNSPSRVSLTSSLERDLVSSVAAPRPRCGRHHLPPLGPCLVRKKTLQNGYCSIFVFI